MLPAYRGCLSPGAATFPRQGERLPTACLLPAEVWEEHIHWKQSLVEEVTLNQMQTGHGLYTRTASDSQKDRFSCLFSKSQVFPSLRVALMREHLRWQHPLIHIHWFGDLYCHTCLSPLPLLVLIILKHECGFCLLLPRAAGLPRVPWRRRAAGWGEGKTHTCAYISAPSPAIPLGSRWIFFFLPKQRFRT